jgi:transcriptional regulator with XRE-family HTH domain
MLPTSYDYGKMIKRTFVPNKQRRKNFMESLSDFIKRKRIENGLSKRKLAQIAGISHTEVHRLENGQRKSPSPSLLVSLAKALDTSVIEILVVANYLDSDFIDKDSLSFLDNYNGLSGEEKLDVKKYLDFIKSKRDRRN